jgi:putative ABC transport system ATP-binding protein
MSLVELRAAGRTYLSSTPVRALHPVDLALESGELVGVVGPSGSGKSTLLHLLGTLDRPSEGEMLFDDRNVKTLADAELAALRADHIGFVFQRFHLLPALDALENVATGLLYREPSRRRRRTDALRALARVGLAERASHRPGELSGGEQQRVAIARAIVGSPDLVLADEPTGNLDTTAGHAVLTLLRDLHSEGATVVIVTHDSDIASALQRRVTLRDGAVVDDVRLA